MTGKTLKPVYEKILEEISELKYNIENKVSSDKIEDEFGDVLFSLVNYSRFLKINPEDALRRTIEKFIFRFQKIEEYAKSNNLDLNNMTLDQMDEVWVKVKNENKGKDNNGS